MSNLTSAIRNEHGTKPRGIVRCVPVNMSFRAEPQFVGSVICGVGLAFHGDAFAAGPYDYPSGTVTIDIVAPPDPTTSTSTDPVPTTETTVP